MIKDILWVAGLMAAICLTVLGLAGVGLSDDMAAFLFGLFLFACYLIPSWIACGRGHHNAVAITLLNVFLGWTFLGWVGALVWSVTAINPASRPAPQTPSPATAQTDPVSTRAGARPKCGNPSVEKTHQKKPFVGRFFVMLAGVFATLWCIAAILQYSLPGDGSLDSSRLINDLGVAIAIGLYFLPAWIADGRRHQNKTPILMLNIFLGWTLLGWVAALIWSMTDINPASRPAPQTPSPATAQTDPANPSA